MTERHEFQAEVKQLLDLMVHSLYSNKEIFLRELISNASDALDRLRFEGLTDESVRSSDELHIRIEPEPETRSLSLIDNGIGMSRDEIIENLGTIARSGTKEFLAALEGKDKTSPDLIGQFGVGFYSSFMVADEVTVVTKKAGATQAYRWSSVGDGAYLLEETERAEAGTTITLKLKEVDAENGIEDFTDNFVLQSIVKRYSDFVSYPIKMNVWTTRGESEAKVLEEKVLNSQKAIWTRPKGEVSEEEYREFYRHISHDWNEPLLNIPVKIEGTFEAQALLFIPSKAPHDLYHPEMRRGIQLFVKRVFIMDECKELLPTHLRFVRGVVDAQDLSLNVSREILQKDRQIRIIRKQLIKKVYAALDNLRDSDAAKFRDFWGQFGPVLKEGLMAAEEKDQVRLFKSMLVTSTVNDGSLTSLEEYVGRMKSDQKEIYYLAGPSLEAVKASPHLEAFQAKGYEVLLFTDQIDELWLDRRLRFDDKPFVSISQGQVELGTKEEREKEEEALDAQQEEHKGLLNALRTHLQDDIKDVRLSGRLTNSPVCLVGDEGDLTPQMEKLMAALNQSVPKVKRILELNPKHALLPRLEAIYGEDAKSPKLETAAKLLYGQALLAEGGAPKDPAEFSRLIADLLVAGL